MAMGSKYGAAGRAQPKPGSPDGVGGLCARPQMASYLPGVVIGVVATEATFH